MNASGPCSWLASDSGGETRQLSLAWRRDIWLCTIRPAGFSRGTQLSVLLLCSESFTFRCREVAGVSGGREDVGVVSEAFEDQDLKQGLTRGAPTAEPHYCRAAARRQPAKRSAYPSILFLLLVPVPTYSHPYGVALHWISPSPASCCRSRRRGGSPWLSGILIHARHGRSSNPARQTQLR